RKRAHRFEIGPGQGAYMPSTSPHLVEVDDEPSVTVSFTYYTANTRRDALLRKARGRLVEYGLHLPPVGQRTWLDQTLHSGAAAAQSLKNTVSQLRGKPTWSDGAAYAAR